MKNKVINILNNHNVNDKIGQFIIYDDHNIDWTQYCFGSAYITKENGLAELLEVSIIKREENWTDNPPIDTVIRGL